MERYYAKKDASNSNTRNKENRLKQKRPRIELDLRDIVDDPGNINFLLKKALCNWYFSIVIIVLHIFEHFESISIFAISISVLCTASKIFLPSVI
jgi:hypothetical protein